MANSIQNTSTASHDATNTSNNISTTSNGATLSNNTNTISNGTSTNGAVAATQSATSSTATNGTKPPIRAMPPLITPPLHSQSITPHIIPKLDTLNESKSPDYNFKRPRDKVVNDIIHSNIKRLNTSQSLDNINAQHNTQSPTNIINPVRHSSRSPVNMIHVNKDQIQIWRHPRVSNELQHDITFVIDNDNSIEFHVHRAILNIVCKLGNEITHAYKDELHKHIILSHNDTGTAQQLKLFFEMLFAEDVKAKFSEFASTVESKILHAVDNTDSKIDFQTLYKPIDQLIHTAQYFGATFLLRCIEDVLCVRLEELYRLNKLHGRELYSLVLSNELWEFSILQSRLVGLLADYLTDSILPYTAVASLAPNTEIEVQHILKLDKLERFERTTLASLVQSLTEKAWHKSMQLYANEQKLQLLPQINNEVYDQQSSTFLPLRDKVFIQMNEKT